MRNRNPFVAVKTWRARDKHTGIDKSEGIPYTYRHVEDWPAPDSEVYRVATIVPLVPQLHRNVHFVPASRLDDFLRSFYECAETVTDVRPLSAAEALAELAEFRRRAEDVEAAAD